ncbi:tetratricopeptide repeat protein [Bifidobacterium amazonense]|uniref:Tetratricopeptide repeat protein n=1 Tax=Bifidobacterium amazonense TaxID=2809027 RepID=A0ABS9VSA7_9BIFI|nr:tetratricopeptide repeat protein [Bifidobacterium amazonense]MCH9274957.1 tetratricopeptide repeat protein [Bifidobacterium amazonense]
MPQHTPHHNHGFGVPAMVDRLVRTLDARVHGRRPTSDNSFGAALNAIGDHASDEDLLKAFRENAIVLSPFAKRRIFDHLAGVPDGITLGWAQLPVKQGSVLALGVFSDRSHFAQLALVDGRGRVFMCHDPETDTQGMQCAFMFGKESELRLPDGPRFGHDSAGSPVSAGRRGGLSGLSGLADAAGDVANDLAGGIADFAGRAGGRRDGAGRSGRGRGHAPRMLDVVQGGIVGRDETGRMIWLASWLKAGSRYTLEQVRAELPPSMRFDLEYRDAIAIAFFAAYMLPLYHGLLIGFGAGNIFRRLNREAPMGAIRRCLRDTLDARAHGMRASGLEDHFADLMHEAGALEPTAGLEAVHGAEPMHLYTSTYSGNYFFTWDSGLQFPAALKSLRIEGNLNRFAAVSAWLERNAKLGLTPIEDTVTRAQAAQIDRMLLDDPALLALSPSDTASGAAAPDASDAAAADEAGHDGWHAVMRLVDEARAQAERIAERNPDPSGAGESRASGSEWLYRQTVSTLLRRLRVPYRFDVEFRSNLADGEAAVGFTTAGPMMMPSSRYDADRHMWVTLSDDERAAMSASYNLRVGLMIAAMMFGADEHVRRVSVHVDSIGLEEAVAEQDSAISDMAQQMMHTLDRLRFGDVGLGGGKADPKDGDWHGDPSRTPPMSVDEGNAADMGDAADPADAAGSSGRSGSDGDADASASDQGAAPGDGPSQDMDHADKATVDSRFEDLMRGVDLDEVVFNVPTGNTADAFDDMEPDPEQGDGDVALPADPSDPLSALRANPTVRTLATVTFTRDALLARLYQDGLEHPADTYRMFDANMSLDGHGALRETDAGFDLRDVRFAPAGAQEEPELSETTFSPDVARVLGARDAADLSIQRVDLLQHGVAEFHRLAADDSLASVDKAQRAMRLIDRIADPELSRLAPEVTSALIDGRDTPDITFQLSDELNRERGKARDMLFSGQIDHAVEIIEAELERLDLMYANNPGVPRYFNSYAERVVYNRLFATSGEQTVLIPDDLFYAHMEVADILSQIKGAQAALPHLNAMVSYAPAYPLSHLKLAMQLARSEDWDSARAACLNALRVALDRDDAAFAYYRFAYAEWMRDQFAVAAAAYIMSDHISPGQIGALDGELRELVARADSQCVPVPDGVEAAKAVLAAHDLPVWPHTEVAGIVRDAARVCVDHGMFVPARTLSVACARMNDDEGDGIDVIQAQFLRSLNA